MPNKPAALLKLKVTPLGSAKTSRPILTPRSPLPSGESTSKNSKEVVKLVTKATAAIVDSERDGRFNLVSSALNTFHLITHPSFRKMCPQVRHELVSGLLKQFLRQMQPY